MLLSRSTLLRTLAVAAVGTFLISQAARAATVTDLRLPQTAVQDRQASTATALAENCYYVDQRQVGRCGKIEIRRVRECD